MAVIRPDRTQLTYDIAAWILAGVSLVLILSLHVLPALLAGLLVYELVHILAPRLKVVRIHQEHGDSLSLWRCWRPWWSWVLSSRLSALWHSCTVKQATCRGS